MAANPLLGGLDTGDYADNSINRAATAGMSAPSRGGRSASADASNLSQIPAETKSRIEDARDEVDRAGARMSFPHLTPPPPQAANTDPFQAFGQPAMWLAAFGSLFTRRPLVNAINAAGEVLKSTHAQDLDAAKRNYETWKVENENAIKMATFEREAYKASLQKLHTEATVGEAMIKTNIAAFRNNNLEHILATEGPDGVKRYLGKHDADASLLSERSLRLQDLMEKHIDQLSATQAWDATHPAPQDPGARDQWMLQRSLAHTMIRAGKDPDEIKGGAAGAGEHDVEILAKDEFKQREGRDPTPDDAAAMAKIRQEQRGVAAASKPAREGTVMADRAKMDGDIRKEHPDWTDSQVIAERNKQVGLGKSLLSGQALENAAAFYDRTGKYPFTARSKEDQDAVLNFRAEHGKGTPESRTGELLENQATLQADERSLNQITKQRDAAQGYERGARAELHLARDNIPKTPEPLNSQLLTQWVRTGDRSFGGVPTAKYMTYLVSGLDEYAKVLSGGTGSAAASTDGSRKQAMELIPPGATTDQIKGIMDALDDGMAVKIKGYDDQVAAIRGRVRGGAQSSAPVKLSPGHEDEDYAVLPSGTKFVDPQGKIRTKP